MSMTIYVGNLPYTATEGDIRNLFAPYGELDSVKLVSDRETGRSRGFGFVEMNRTQGAAAIQALNNKDHAGRPLRVNEAKDRPPRKSFGGGNGGGGGGGFRGRG